MDVTFLEGRVAWVTGGGSGMGKAIALALADAGAKVAIGSLVRDDASNLSPEQCVHLASQAELDAAAREIERRGTEAMALPLDVCSEESVQSFYRMVVNRFGSVDILVNAAGSSARHMVVGHP